MTKFKKNQVVWDKLLNQGTSIIAVSPAGVFDIPAGVIIYRCYSEAELPYGSFRLEEELSLMPDGEQPLEPERP